jgi:protein subunit release factor A
MFKTFCKIVKKNYCYPSLLKYNQYLFFSTINQIAPNLEIKDLTKTLYVKLQKADDEFNQLTEKLLKHNTTMSTDELSFIRTRTEEINQHHEIFLQLKDCLKTMQDLINMKKEAVGDKETLDFLESEMKRYEETLGELEEKAIEILIPPEEYDDRTSIKLEIRAGLLVG